MEQRLASSALYKTAALILFSALLQILALRNELFSILGYWLYICCIPPALLLLLIWRNEAMRRTKWLFEFAALLAFTMLFVCWRERTLTSSAYINLCVIVAYLSEFALLFAILAALHNNFSGYHRPFFFLQKFILYGAFVPSASWIVCIFILGENLISVMAVVGRELLAESFASYAIFAAKLLVSLCCGIAALLKK